MKLVTNCDKKYLNHNLMAAKAIKLEVYIDKAYDVKGNYLPELYGIYAKKEEFTHYMNCKFWAAVEQLGIKILNQWKEKGYELNGAMGFQFYLDITEEEVREIEQELKNKKKNIKKGN